jgi:hypothetical protein
MYGYIGAGLMGLFILMVLPAGMDNIQEDGKFYGAANLLVRDAAGNELFEQTVHNRLLDTGENYIVNQTFVGGSALGADNSQMSAICVTNITTVSETDTAATFSAPANTLNGTNNCHTTVPIIPNDGTVVLGPETFTGGTDIGATETIRSIAICADNDGLGDYTDCDAAASNAIAFAAIVTSSVQLGNTETVDVTYTFDMSSPNN